MTDPNTNVDLIGKFLTGETSPAEEAELMAWVNASPANSKFFEEMQSLWGISATFHPQPQLDVAQAWEQLDARLSKAIHPSKSLTPPNDGPAKTVASSRRTLFPRNMPLWLRVAAVLLPLAVALWWWQDSRETTPEALVFQTSSDERRLVQLPDGSTVHLNHLTVLTYTEDYGGRHVVLEGEAYFDVAHQEGKPFVILSGGARTTVVGTSFNVRAYPGEPQVEVSVVSGKVQVESALAPEQHTLLQAGQAAILQKDKGEVTLEGELAANAAAWKSRRLQFQDARVSEVAAALERYFDVRILLQDPAIGNCRFSGTYEDPKLTDVLEALTFAMELQLEAKDTVYTIRGAGCPQ